MNTNDPICNGFWMEIHYLQYFYVVCLINITTATENKSHINNIFSRLNKENKKSNYSTQEGDLCSNVMLGGLINENPKSRWLRKWQYYN